MPAFQVGGHPPSHYRQAKQSFGLLRPLQGAQRRAARHRSRPDTRPCQQQGEKGKGKGWKSEENLAERIVYVHILFTRQEILHFFVDFQKQILAGTVSYHIIKLELSFEKWSIISPSTFWLFWIHFSAPLSRSSFFFSQLPLPPWLSSCGEQSPQSVSLSSAQADAVHPTPKKRCLSTLAAVLKSGRVDSPKIWFIIKCNYVKWFTVDWGEESGLMIALIATTDRAMRSPAFCPSRMITGFALDPES